jgi:hypothetical protein
MKNEEIAHRKHIIADQIRYIGKESNNLEDNLLALKTLIILNMKILKISNNGFFH